MRKHAVLDNNIVVEILELDEESYTQKAAYHELIFDIHDLIIQPQVGWILVGNQLMPPSLNIPIDQLIKAKIKQYQDAAPELLRDLYTQNTLLGITVQESDQMFEYYSDVLMRLREGAWPTAVYRLGQKQPSGFVTQQMIDGWTALISSRM